LWASFQSMSLQLLLAVAAAFVAANGAPSTEVFTVDFSSGNQLARSPDCSWADLRTNCRMTFSHSVHGEPDGIAVGWHVGSCVRVDYCGFVGVCGTSSSGANEGAWLCTSQMQFYNGLYATLSLQGLLLNYGSKITESRFQVVGGQAAGAGEHFYSIVGGVTITYQTPTVVTLNMTTFYTAAQ